MNPYAAITGLADHPNVLKLVGGIITSYAELEFRMLHIFNYAKGLPEDDLTLFETRMESRRFNTFKEAVEPVLQQNGMAQEYTVIANAMEKCRQYRNQYAHCVWSTKKPLHFFSFEEAALASPTGLPYKKTSEQLLTDQLNYIVDLAILLTESQKKLKGQAQIAGASERCMATLATPVADYIP